MDPAHPNSNAANTPSPGLSPSKLERLYTTDSCPKNLDAMSIFERDIARMAKHPETEEQAQIGQKLLKARRASVMASLGNAVAVRYVIKQIDQILAGKLSAQQFFSHNSYKERGASARAQLKQFEPDRKQATYTASQDFRAQIVASIIMDLSRSKTRLDGWVNVMAQACKEYSDTGSALEHGAAARRIRTYSFKIARELNELGLNRRVRAEIKNEIRRAYKYTSPEELELTFLLPVTFIGPMVERLKQAESMTQAIVAELIERNQGLVLWQARKHDRFIADSSVEFGDLVLAGNRYLRRGIERWDYRKGTFSTYIGWWIRVGIQHFLSQFGNVVRVPESEAKRSRQILRQRNQLESEKVKILTVEELAKELKLPLKHVKAAFMYERRKKTIEVKAFEYDQDSGDQVHEPHAEDPAFEHKDRQRALAQVKQIVVSLPAREREILYLRFPFLNGGDPNSEIIGQREAGRLIDRCYELVRQIEQRAFKRIRARVTHQKLGWTLEDQRLMAKIKGAERV